MTSRTTTLSIAAALAASLPLAAHTADPGPSMPPDVYRSAFEDYRPFGSGEVADWRESNDTVRDIGGWRAYAREIQQGAKEGAALPSGGKAADGEAAPSNPHRGQHQ